jgi:hypothetical protein
LGWVIGLLGLGVVLFFMVGSQEAEVRVKDETPTYSL